MNHPSNENAEPAEAAPAWEPFSSQLRYTGDGRDADQTPGRFAVVGAFIQLPVASPAGIDPSIEGPPPAVERP